jgi:hypothetical protein
MRGRVTWRGVGDALVVVWGGLMAASGLAMLVMGRSGDAGVPLGMGVFVLMLWGLGKRRASAAAEVDEPRRVEAPRRRVAIASGAAFLAATVVGFVSGKLGLAESPDATVLPPLPLAPAGAVEYLGETSDGMQVALWRRPGSVIVRVDSAASDCGIGKNFAQAPMRLRRASRFGKRWTFHTTALFSEPRLGGLLPAGEVVLPKRVDAEAYGRFLPGGRAEGRFTRRDMIRDGEETVLDCTRSVEWAAKAI